MDVTAKGPLCRLAERFDHENEKVSGSRFITTLVPAKDPDEIVALQRELRAQHPHSRHVCFAFVGQSELDTRYSDDGEPGKTAGLPMLRVLLGGSLRNSGALVTRYFGGVKLGTGGLVRAYTHAVRQALELAPVIPFVESESRVITCTYALEPKVRHWAAHHGVEFEVMEYGPLSVRVCLSGQLPNLQALSEKLSAETELNIAVDE